MIFPRHFNERRHCAGGMAASMPLNGGGGKQTSTTQNYSPEEAARRTKVMDEAMAVYEKQKKYMADNPDLNPIAKPAGMSQDTTDALGRVKGDVANLDHVAGKARETLDYYLSGALLNPDSNPGLKAHMQGVADQMRADATEGGGLFSQLRNSSVADGSFGSSRQGIAEALAVNKVNQNIGTTMAGMANENYRSGLNAMTTALGFAPAVGEMQSAGTNRLAEAGSIREQYTQEQNDYQAQLNEWKMNKDSYPLQSLASIVYGGGSSQSTSTTSAGGSKARSRLGGAAAGAMAGASFGPWGMAIGAVAGALMG